MKRIILLGLLTLLAHSASAAKSDISVSIEPQRIAADETAQLTITVSGALGSEGTLPNVDGLEFTPTGQSSQYQSINGEVTESQSLIYLVTATRAGTFTIPALRIGNGHDAASSSPVVLRVTGSGRSPTPTGQPQTTTLPPPNVPANGQMAFLRLASPKREFYVGELVPVEIKAYFRAGIAATLNGLPRLSSDAFTMNRLDDKPGQSKEIVDGQPYIVLTWTTALSAVKAGEYSLGLELPVLVRTQESRRVPQGLFDDSFFDNFFGRVVEKPVTLKTEPGAVKALPLPTENRPVDFTGAVGRFNVAVEAAPTQITAGDPITLRLKITGAGNFDRVSSSLLAASPEWKTYKPVARFETADSIGYQGAKTFEQAVVPAQDGKRNIPSLAFSFFDPETRQYVTRKTEPLSVQIARGSTATALIQAPVTAVPPPIPTDEQPELASNRVEPGRFVSQLRPLLLQPRFLIVNSVALAAFAAAFPSFRRRDKLARDPRHVRASQAGHAISEQFAAMESALQRTEAGDFFTAARRALQQRLGELWNLPPTTITLAEINARLGEAEDLRRIFEIADQSAYSDGCLAFEDLAEWQAIVTKELERLK